MGNMKKFFLLVTPFILLLSSCGCKDASTSYFQADSAWYKNPAVPDTNFIDVFYIASTEVLKSYNPDGSESYTALLTPEEKGAIKRELDFVSLNYFPDSVNMFAPYTHQYTMGAVMLPRERFDSTAAVVANEVCEAFDYYMEHLNGGRRFVIAGFSQGAQMTLAVLKRLTDERYSRMVAAYSIGYGVNDDDLKSPYIKPAQNATDTGVTISYNSVSEVSNMWDFVQNDAAVCINPVNWSVTPEPAEFTYYGQKLSATLDTANNVLIVRGFDEKQLSFEAPWPVGNLHHYDLLFYAPMIKENIHNRLK